MTMSDKMNIMNHSELISDYECSKLNNAPVIRGASYREGLSS